ncbi:DNA-binding helix-turn-helix protein [Leptospira ryugenii]|uniref:DNA-binding helix-turn-helix protein n=2 Tax=Leptospira ryugenii TaxID=1917863 RepID=A0A2P2E310_9LEPT|nr:DNA-binding helix-turn-helix protein [Leptospira ryugenii]
MARLGFLLGALIGPTFGIAIRAHLGYPKDFWGELIPFLVPVGILIYSFPFFLQSSADKLAFIRADLIAPHPECTFMSLFAVFSNAISFGRVYFRLKDFEDEFPKESLQEVKLFQNYLRTSSIVFLFVCIFYVFVEDRRVDTVTNIAIAIWVLGFAWFRFYSESNLDRPVANVDLSEPNKELKYKKSFLSQNQLDEMGKQIVSLLDDKEMYKDADLSLDLIAKYLKTNHQTVSQVINRYFHKSFLELIREYRIQNSKELLIQTDHPILRIGLDAGFNSKTSFLRAFREEVGCTPSEFRERHSVPNQKRT